MIALRTYLPTLASELGKTTDQMNEWLRALVAEKALVPRSGRGPGSGVELNAESISIFLLALLSSDIRNEAVSQAKAIAKAKPVRFKWCPVSKARTLHDAIIVGLEGGAAYEGVAYQLAEIQMARGMGTAILFWVAVDPAAHPTAKVQPITYSLTKEIPKSKLSVSGTIHHDAIAKIARDLQDLNSARSDSIVRHR